MLDKTTQSRVQRFASEAGVSTEYFLSKIANEWLDEKGDYVLGRLQQMRNKSTVKPLKPARKKKPARAGSLLLMAPIALPVAINHAVL